MRRDDWCEFHQKHHIKEHGHSAYTNHRCRCTDCRVGLAQYHMQWRASVARREVPPHVHGSSNGYTNYSCRCGDCVESNRVEKADYRDRKKSADKAGK